MHRKYSGRSGALNCSGGSQEAIGVSSGRVDLYILGRFDLLCIYFITVKIMLQRIVCLESTVLTALSHLEG